MTNDGVPLTLRLDNLVRYWRNFQTHNDENQADMLRMCIRDLERVLDGADPKEWEDVLG